MERVSTSARRRRPRRKCSESKSRSDDSEPLPNHVHRRTLATTDQPDRLRARSHDATRVVVLRCGNRVSVRAVLLTARLRNLPGLSWSEISRRHPVGESSAKRRYQIHRAWMGSLGSMEEYREVVGAVAGECLRG